MDSNEDHRARIERLRRWEAEQRQARETQAEQRQAAERKRRQTIRGALIGRFGMALMALGLVIGLVHMLRHLAGNPSGLEDITVGYPTAAGVLIVGLILIGVR